MGLKEQDLDEIVSDHQDLAKAKADYQKDFETNQKFQDAQSRLFAATRGKKWDDAQTTLNEIFLLFPKMTNGFTTTRLQILIGQKKYDEAYALADDTGKAHSTDDDWQNILAWTIATSASPDEHCLGLAKTMAECSVQLSQSTNSASLDTLARVQFMLGKKPEAIATEEKAMGVEQNPREKEALGKTLASYQQGKLPEINE
jgi:tetratricopeptide (TPR) repeat protein